MYKYLLAFCMCAGIVPAVFSLQTCDINKQTPIRVMQQELKRNFRLLHKQHPPIYYLSYTYENTDIISISAALNASSLYRDTQSNLSVQARAGSPVMDNTRALKGERTNFYKVYRKGVPAPQEGQTRPFKLWLWSATEQAVEEAQREYTKVAAYTRSMTEVKDNSNDFVFPPIETACYTDIPPEIDVERVKELVEQAAKLPMGNPDVLNYNVSLRYAHTQRYFVDSRGTRLVEPKTFMRLSYFLYNRTQDGMELERFKDYNVASADELPTLEQLQADIQQSLAELTQLSQAPEGDPLTAPTLLKGRAAAVFVHEVLGHRLEGHRQKDDSEGQTFTGKVGQQVISPLLTIVDDPTQTTFQGEALRGHYLYDEQGVKARPITLVENGILRNFLMASSPIKGFSASNGHGRSDGEHRAVARMGHMRTTASQTVPYEQLEKMLVDEIKKQGKPYGFIVEDLGGGFTYTGKAMPQSFKLEAKTVWKVYPDGHKELVRGLELVGTPLVSFNKVLAAGDDDELFNGSCGAESGWVAQSNIAPSLLFESLEMERMQTSPWKPPLLPSPLQPQGGKK